MQPEAVAAQTRKLIRELRAKVADLEQPCTFGGDAWTIYLNSERTMQSIEKLSQDVLRGELLVRQSISECRGIGLLALTTLNAAKSNRLQEDEEVNLQIRASGSLLCALLCAQEQLDSVKKEEAQAAVQAEMEPSGWKAIHRRYYRWWRQSTVDRRLAVLEAEFHLLETRVRVLEAEHRYSLVLARVLHER
jgi:hypothetical protein